MEFIDFIYRRTLENYFIWNCMYSMLIDFMPAKYIEAKLNLTKVYKLTLNYKLFQSLFFKNEMFKNQIVTGVDKMKPRDKFCTSYASNYMSIATSRLYVENNFPKIAKIKVRTRLIFCHLYNLTSLEFYFFRQLK